MTVSDLQTLKVTYPHGAISKPGYMYILLLGVSREVTIHGTKDTDTDQIQRIHRSRILKYGIVFTSKQQEDEDEMPPENPGLTSASPPPLPKFHFAYLDSFGKGNRKGERKQTLPLFCELGNAKWRELSVCPSSATLTGAGSDFTKREGNMTQESPRLTKSDEKQERGERERISLHKMQNIDAAALRCSCRAHIRV